MHRVKINHSKLIAGSKSCSEAQLKGFVVDGSVFPMHNLSTSDGLLIDIMGLVVWR